MAHSYLIEQDCRRSKSRLDPGEDYSIKAPAGEEQTLLNAAMMLKAALAETKRKYSTLIGERTASAGRDESVPHQIEMQKQHKLELDRYQEQVSATVETIARTIGQG